MGDQDEDVERRGFVSLENRNKVWSPMKREVKFVRAPVSQPVSQIDGFKCCMRWCGEEIERPRTQERVVEGQIFDENLPCNRDGANENPPLCLPIGFLISGVNSCCKTNNFWSSGA